MKSVSPKAKIVHWILAASNKMASPINYAWNRKREREKEREIVARKEFMFARIRDPNIARN